MPLQLDFNARFCRTPLFLALWLFFLLYEIDLYLVGRGTSCSHQEDTYSLFRPRPQRRVAR